MGAFSSGKPPITGEVAQSAGEVSAHHLKGLFAGFCKKTPISCEIFNNKTKKYQYHAKNMKIY